MPRRCAGAWRRGTANAVTAKRLRAWWPALAWAVLMFYLSTDAFSSPNTSRFLGPLIQWLYPSVTREQLAAVNYFVRKSAHFTEYFILALLVYRGIANGRAVWRLSWACGALVIVGTYSLLDEFHQSFVASRTSSPWDSLLDSTGALFALAALYVFARRMAARAAR